MSHAAYPPYGQPPPQGQWGASPPIPPRPSQQGYGYGYNHGPPTPQSPYPAAPQGPSPYPPYAQPPPQSQSPYPPYSQPTPQGYGAPPGPPPVELYGSPVPSGAHDHYNRPPPPPPSGPPQAQYGAPPPSHSPMPPYGGAPQYGAPMSMGMGMGMGMGVGGYPTPPSLGYGAPQVIPWDPTPSANALRKAMKGFGTDEKVLIRELADKDPFQVQAINDAYQRIHKRNLVADIKDETSGWFQYGLVQLVRGPLMTDVHMLYDSMSGPGTKEKVLNDVLLGRSNADINAIKGAYRQTFHKDLIAAVKDDLSLKTERHFELVLSAQRAEDSAPLIKADIDRDVDALYSATEGKVGTDEMRVCSILSTRSDNQIRAIAHEYRIRYARDLKHVIRKEFRGHMEEALLFQLGRAMDKRTHQAELLEETMSGTGTKDYLLVSRLVRCHWDRSVLDAVKAEYARLYGKTLAQRIEKKLFSGDYQRLMIACVGGR